MSTDPTAEPMTHDVSASQRPDARGTADASVTDAAMAADALAGGGPGAPSGANDAAPPGAPTTGAAAAATSTEAAADTATAAAATAAGAPAEAVAAAQSAPAAPTTRARARVLGFGKRLVRFVVTVALFSAGIVAGWQYFVGSQPVAAPVGDPAVVGNPTPAVVAELANAIAADDSDAIRAALLPEIFSSYTADLQSFGLTRVEGVETLGTYIDGPRTATVLVIHGRDVERNPFSINLVVLTQDGKIVRLR